MQIQELILFCMLILFNVITLWISSWYDHELYARRKLSQTLKKSLSHLSTFPEKKKFESVHARMLGCFICENKHVFLAVVIAES